MGSPPPPPDAIAELTRQVASLTTQFEAMRKYIEDTAASSHRSSEFHNRPRLKLDVPQTHYY
jgi:hypothetical protein